VERMSAEETRLVEGLRAHDEAAFALLVRTYGPSMLRVAQLYVRNRAVAEDVVQDAWLGVMNGISGFEGRSSLKTSALGREQSASPSVDADRFLGPETRYPGHWGAPPTGWAGGPEERLVASETLELIRAEIDKLPPVQALVITMRDIEGFGSEEVCNALQISDTNQRVLLHRARTRVRRALEDYMT
jgi:RNA polymerase sigma-70 factor, ECF subfamily